MSSAMRDKCDMTDCRNRAQIKISDPNGWIAKYCFKHTMRFIGSRLRNIATLYPSFALYIQKYLTVEEAEAAARRARNYEP